MLVSPKDGSCRECGGCLEIIDADDATLTVSCLQCATEYVVETDAFNDGGVGYWPAMMVQLTGGVHEDD